MPANTTLRNAVLFTLYGAAALTLSPAVHAQTTAPADTAAAPMQTVTLVGSRRATSSATDTVVPVDIIPMNKVSEQGGQFDLAQSLTYISPSFNSTRRSGSCLLYTSPSPRDA